MKKTIAWLAGLVVAVAPLVASGQGLRVSSVIPTQSLVQHAAAFPYLAQRARAVVAVASPPTVVCNMPVSTPPSRRPGAPATDAGGVAAPGNRAVQIPTTRSACVNRMAMQAPDSDLLKKQ